MTLAKRTLSMLLAVLMLTALLASPVEAASLMPRAYAPGEGAGCGDSADWTLTGEGVLTITGTGAMYDYSPTAPAPWSDLAGQVKSVQVGSGITHLGAYAFAGCGKLKSVTLPEGLRTIGEGAFLGCSYLKKVELPEHLVSIGAYAFGWKSVGNTLEGVTLIGGSAAKSYCTANGHVTCQAPAQAPENPTVTGLTLLEKGMAVKWKPVTGVKKYKVYFRVDGGTWKSAGTTTGTSMNVTGLTSGRRYTFAVSSLWEKGEVEPQAQRSRSATFVAAPQVKSVGVGSNSNTVTVKWTAVAGAGKYRVFYKTGSSGWKAAGDTASTSLQVSGIKTGKAYSYTVRALSATGKSYVSTYNAKGVQYTLLDTPVVTRAENAKDGVSLKWNRVSGAAKYRVFYRSSGAWVKAGDTTATSFVVKNLTGGRRYAFTVRCISADGKRYTSYYSTAGLKQTYLAAPALKSAGVVNEGVKLTWEASAGVSQYRVFYKTGSGSWKQVADTVGTSYTVTGLDSGSSYTFTVRGLSATGKSFVTGYDSRGRSVTYIAPPELENVEYDDGGITISWQDSDGAEKYRVFYRRGSSWVKLGDTTDCFFYTRKLDNTQRWTFTVRCISADGKRFTSGYDTAGIAASYIPGKPYVYSFSSAYTASRFYDQLMDLYLGSNPRDSLVDVALSQLGYTEGNQYGQWGGTTGGGNNYTEFGRWYDTYISGGGGFYAGAWCCMFVSWCANEAGISTSVIPRRALVENMDDWFGGRYYTWNQTACGYGSKRIQKGDLIIYSASAGGRLSHIGIVTDVTYNGERCTISTVEGNVDDACRTRRFILTKARGGRIDDSHYIRGFCCPNY